MKNEPNQQGAGQCKILLNPILAMIVVLSLGCSSQSGDSPTARGAGNTGAGASSGQWKTYTHPELGVSVKTPESWNVSPGKAFSAYSGEGLASVMMSRAQIIPRSPATTAADFLAEKMESFEKNEIGQPVTHLGKGTMSIAGTTGEWVEVSMANPKAWMRVICFVTDKPYIIFCTCREYASDSVAELNRELPFDVYQKQVVEVAQTVSTP